MTKLPSAVIGKLAINAIDTEILKNSPLIDPKLNVDDTLISFDGDLELHNSNTWSRKTFVSHISTQVKGKQSSDFSRKSISYSLELDHYRNFYNAGGVLFFVVLVNENKNTKIYYKQLLPLELSSIIDNYGHQETCTMQLQWLENDNIQDICLDYYDSQRKQPLVLVESRFSTSVQVNRIVMKSSTFKSQNWLDHEIFEHGFDFYVGDNDLLYPKMHAKILEIKMKLPQFIFIDNHITDAQVMFTNQKNKFLITFENIFNIEYDLKKSKIRYDLFRFGSLQDQQKILPIAIAFLSGKAIRINDFELPGITLNRSSLKKELDQFIRLFDIVQRSIKVFNFLDVPVNRPIGESTLNHIVDQLLLLNRVVLDKNYDDLDLSTYGRNGLSNIVIGSLNIITFYDVSNEQRFNDPFGPQYRGRGVFIEFEPNNPRYPHTIFSMFNVEMLIQTTNIDAQKIIYEFDSIDPFLNAEIQALTIEFCLNCIQAYDENRNEDLLIAARHILQKYPCYNDKSKISELDWSLNYLNLSQIHVRLETTLPSEEEDIMREMIFEANKQDHFNISFGAAVVLKNKQEATYYLKKLDLEDQDLLQKYPIYTLYQNL